MQPSLCIYNIAVHKILYEMITYSNKNISHSRVRNQYNPFYINRTYKLLRLLSRLLRSALLMATIMSWLIVMCSAK